MDERRDIQPKNSLQDIIAEQEIPCGYYQCKSQNTVNNALGNQQNESQTKQVKNDIRIRYPQQKSGDGDNDDVQYIILFRSKELPPVKPGYFGKVMSGPQDGIG